MDYFNYAVGLTMCNDKLWTRLFGIPHRSPESELTQPYMNLALAIQQITEEIVIKLAKTARQLTGCRYVTLAGGVALNCVANGKLLLEGVFDDLWIQPAAGDASGALGAAYTAWHIGKGMPRCAAPHDAMKGSCLGPEFSGIDIQRIARKFNAPYVFFDDAALLCATIADYLSQGLVVGWFQGKMEFGPRALGNRSILGDPRNPDMQKRMNLKIKFREGFRPFAPSVLEEDISRFFPSTALLRTCFLSLQ